MLQSSCMPSSGDSLALPKDVLFTLLLLLLFLILLPLSGEVRLSLLLAPDRGDCTMEQEGEEVDAMTDDDGCCCCSCCWWCRYGRTGFIRYSPPVIGGFVLFTDQNSSCECHFLLKFNRL